MELETSLTIPPSGKSYFLNYALVRRLYERQPTTYQSNSNYGFSFSARGFQVYANARLPDEDHAAGTWHLVDSNEDLEKLPSHLRLSKGQIVQATSPKLSRYKEWTKQWSPFATLLWMEPLGWQELYVMA